ncbi:hypothetical protein MKZ38_010035 [Zalerion maritima]|uniref:Uncharacterized protein n=1 Tax=Zalerion maritima TaxID=339359 RepID=A0AAD5WUE8_9PEZI|nr:hypothetical protein MKZ38_010035 [Zalerion maritima]
MGAIAVDLVEDAVYSYLDTRDPKGGGGGGGRGGGGGSKSKSKGSKIHGGGGGGGGGGEPLETWEIIVVVVVVIWVIYLLCLWIYFQSKEKSHADPSNPGTGTSGFRPFGKALMFALFITPSIWAFKKISHHFQKDKGDYAEVGEDRSRLICSNDDSEPTYYAGAGAAEQKTSPLPYEPMGSPQPPPMAPSPMTSRNPSPAPPYRSGGAASSYYALPPAPPPAAAHYYDPVSR